jgi:flagellar basal-body rod modification protein FlgD
MSYLSSLMGAPSAQHNALVSDPRRTKPDQQQFLQLLTTQLANQDPMNPQDSQAFVEQLATFSSLEQLENINNGLDELSMAQASVVSATAVDFAGRIATVAEDNFTLAEDEPAKLGAYLSEGGMLRATIKDSSGKVVDTIELGSQKAGIVHFEWSGISEDGPAPSGDYKFEVELVDGEKSTPVTTLVRAPVDSVTFDKGFAELRILGRLFGLGKVLEIG